MGLKVGVTGSSGLIGSALVPSLTVAGHDVTRLPRPGTTTQPLPANLDAVVHLAGESIAGRWTPAKKARIRDSRIAGTRALVEQFAQAASPPRVLIAASATGIYGNRGDELLDESSTRGHGFLPDVVDAWELSARNAESLGTRVALLRFGMILSPRGGALATMLRPFRFGLGGPLGDGHQFWSWLSIDDAVGIIQQALSNEEMVGAVNAVAPESLRNRDFTALLARQLGRPALLPTPAWALRMTLGQMADELLLASARVAPKMLVERGYAFQHRDLAAALRHLLS